MRVRAKNISYLIFEQIPNHLCVACRRSQVKGCHLVHVCVWEPEHACLPQIMHCDTGKDNSQCKHDELMWLCHKHKTKTSNYVCDVWFPPLTCFPHWPHDAVTFFPAGLWGANQLHTASFGVWYRCSLAWWESKVQTVTKNQVHHDIVTLRI